MTALATEIDIAKVKATMKAIQRYQDAHLDVAVPDQSVYDRMDEIIKETADLWRRVCARIDDAPPETREEKIAAHREAGLFKKLWKVAALVQRVAEEIRYFDGEPTYSHDFVDGLVRGLLDAWKEGHPPQRGLPLDLSDPPPRVPTPTEP